MLRLLLLRLFLLRLLLLLLSLLLLLLRPPAPPARWHEAQPARLPCGAGRVRVE